MNDARDIFLRRVYDRSFQDLKTLSAKLPEDTVITLAREVLLHVASKADPDLPAPADIETLALDLIHHDPDRAAGVVRSIQTAGASIADIYLHHLAAAARQLGAWWETDRISLVDVTVGTGRIFAIMRGLAPLFTLPDPGPRKSALFAAVPDETHTLGMKMAADLFRQNDWDIDLRLGATNATLAAEIADHPPRIVGLSAGGMHATAALAKIIITIRIHSPATAILVSGQVVNDAPDIVALMQPDAMTTDFDTTEVEMNRLWTATTPQ